MGDAVTGLGEREVGFGVERRVLVKASQKPRIAGGGDHGGVVGGKRAAGERTLPSRGWPPSASNSAAKFAIRGNAAGNQNRARVLLLGCRQRARNKIVHDANAESSRSDRASGCVESGRKRIGFAFAPRKGLLARLDFRLQLRIAPQVIEQQRS